MNDINDLPRDEDGNFVWGATNRNWNMTIHDNGVACKVVIGENGAVQINIYKDGHLSSSNEFSTAFRIPEKVDG